MTYYRKNFKHLGQGGAGHTLNIYTRALTQVNPALDPSLEAEEAALAQCGRTAVGEPNNRAVNLPGAEGGRGVVILGVRTKLDHAERP